MTEFMSDHQVQNLQPAPKNDKKREKPGNHSGTLNWPTDLKADKLAEGKYAFMCCSATSGVFGNLGRQAPSLP